MAPKAKYKECPACAEHIRENAKICRFCGAVLDKEAPLPAFAASRRQDSEINDSIEQRFSETGLEMSESHRRRIVEFLKASEDQYRIGTVLFVDIAGYTRLCQKLSGEKIQNLISAYCSIFIQTVEFYHGFVVEFAGDGALAVFGAPLGFERDAEAAVHAALEVHRLTASVPVFRQHGVKLSSGIATGRVLSTIVRTKSPPHYKIFGPALNLAARVRTTAGDGEVLIESATRELVQGVFELDDLGPQRYKNIPIPQTVYRVRCAKSRNIQRRDASAPYVGRRAEREALRQAIVAGLGSPAPPATISCAIISGEAGIGKSRLAAEVVAEFKSSVRVLKVECTTFDSKIPWNLWRTIICSTWDGSTYDDPQEVQPHVRSLAQRLHLSPETTRTIEALVGTATSAYMGKAAASPDVFRNVAAADISILLSKLAAEQSIILLLDDLQWADTSSLALLTSIVHEHRPPNVYFVLAHRSEYSLPGNWNSALRVELKPLNLDERRDLLNLLLDARQFLPEVRDRISEQIDGTPFYLVELVKSLRARILESGADSRALSREFKNWVPAPLHEMLQARLDILDQQRKLVLQCASVIGQRFTLQILDFYEQIRENLVAKLYALKTLEFIDDIPLPEGLEFNFRHSMMREVAYSSLLERQRRELHRIIAERLEASRPRQIKDFYHLLAYHYDMADCNEKAVQYLLKAGGEALKSGAVPEGLANYESAVTRLDGGFDIVDRDRLLESALGKLGFLYRLSGNVEKSEQALERALAICRKLKSPVAEAEKLEQLGLLHAQTGNYAKAKRTLSRALMLARKHGGKSLQGRIHNANGVCAWNQGKFAQAGVEYRASERLLDPKEDIATLADVKNNLGLLEWKAGRLPNARDLLQETMKLRKRAGNRHGVALANINLGIILEELGRTSHAIARYRKAIEIAAEIDFVQVFSAAHSNLANLYLTEEDYTRALQESALSHQLAIDAHDRRSAAIALENMALAHLGLGRHAECADCIRQGLEIAAELNDPERQFSLELVRLEHLITQGMQTGLAALFKRAEGNLRQNGFIVERPRVLRIRALASLRAGDLRAARRFVEQGRKEAERLNIHSETARLRRLGMMVEGQKTPS